MVNSQVAFLTKQLPSNLLSLYGTLEVVREKSGDENSNAYDLSIPPTDPSKRKASEAKVKTKNRELELRDELFRAETAGLCEDQPTRHSSSSLKQH